MDDEKLTSFDKRIQRFKDLGKEIEGVDKNSHGQAHSLAMRMVTDLGAAIFVGFMIGYGLDELLGTKPVFLLIFLFAGIAAGFLNVYRAAIKESDEGSDNS